MIVSIHQPNVLPWLGFFHKMACSDLFILLDTVQFTKNGYQNRTMIDTQGGTKWLTIPVAKEGLFGTRTIDVRIANNRDWQADHLRQLEASYGRCPGYLRRKNELLDLYGAKYERLVDFAIPSIELLMNWLDIRTPLIRSSSMLADGSKSELLAQLVHEAGGDVYLSGPSGRDYLDESIFHKYGIRVEYHEFTPFSYPQRHAKEGFTGGLSSLDYAMQVETLHWKEATV
ncbi:WbqC-like family protein [Paenibacillus alvei TS-15]|uniref:WbqC-like family protein n=1 Tax=Paenibacillus alvei TS-15 TaxID=1117108 RepID=S9SR65_PAEAL|nr:WbqC family protein [Paenibacillus alvei]EPY07184.1 WbqC-like family protein [Paenibacillus alvei TS-15]